MTIVSSLADGTKEVFESGNYRISTVKDMHPMIVSVKVYSNGKKIAGISRRFPFFYKHFTFKSEKVQTVLKQIDEQRKMAEQAKNEDR